MKSKLKLIFSKEMWVPILKGLKHLNTIVCRDGESAQIWSQLQFEHWCFDGSDWLLENL